MSTETNYMEVLQRVNATQNNQEILTSYEWSLKFTHKPNVVFMPDDSLFEMRLKSVDVSGIDSNVSVLSAELRGFTLYQPGTQDNVGTLSLTFQDFEDQAISVMCQDWCDKCNTRNARRSAHKRDIYADIIIYRLNSFRVPVYQIECSTCIPTGCSYSDQFTTSKSLLGNVSLRLNCEYVVKTNLNLV